MCAAAGTESKEAFADDELARFIPVDSAVRGLKSTARKGKSRFKTTVSAECGRWMDTARWVPRLATSLFFFLSPENVLVSRTRSSRGFEVGSVSIVRTYVDVVISKLSAVNCTDERFAELTDVDKGVRVYALAPQKREKRRIALSIVLRSNRQNPLIHFLHF